MEFERLNLKAASEYKYLNQSGCLTIDNVDDAQKFQKLMEALNTIHMSKEDQEHAFEMLAAVLWLGNISFQVTDNENHVDVVADEACTRVASLMGCSAQDLILALSTYRIQAGKDNLAKKLTLQQAIDTRGALAKFVYASLFDWLVEEINRLLEKGKRQTRRSTSILDIYGFESFQRNSFEQFCINYANERLQQHFNRHLFKLQQEEYEVDGIDWTKIEFEDNQECLDLFEKKPIGLISLLDEESNFPKASDLTFANKLKQHLNTNPCFKGERGGAFSIHHYAGESQLFKLMQQLENSTPHFIRCIKPNSKQLPGIYEKNLVLEQLRCCGVLEVVRISRSGYPTRMTHQEFAGRYGFLLSEFGVSQDPLSISVSVLQQFGVHPEMYQVGYTKLYFRVGQIGSLEETRKQVLQGTIKVQKCFRRHQARRYFHELKRGVITLQSFVRSENVRKQYDVLINLRQQVARKTLDEQLTAVLHLQPVIRGWLARKHFNHLRNFETLNHDNSSSRNKQGRRISAVMDMPQQHNEIPPSVIEELQRRVLKAEASLEKKEQENAALRDQVQQFEVRWLEYEAKMKSMEDMWQKQTASLQMGLAAVKKSLVADSTSGQPGRRDGSLSPLYYDSEDTNSMGTQTPGTSTPIKICNSVSEFGAGRLSNGYMNAVSQLMKEFEQRKQNFDDDAKAITEVNSGHSPSANPDEELRSLKHKFDTWKKDYKARLRETKARLPKLGLSEAEKHRRKWWGGKSKKI